MTAPLLSVRDLTVRFGPVTAVRAVSFAMAEGETLALVGESGSGKSTVARAILGLHPIASGGIAFAGQELVGASCATLRTMRGDVQMVFQDPGASLNPRMTVRRALAEPLAANAIADGDARIAEICDLCSIPDSLLGAVPAQLSGGQKQRVAIARALVLRPRLLIADEPLSALDVSIQAQIVTLLEDLKVRLGLAVLFISHDLALVRQFCDRAVILYRGEVVEQGPCEAVIGSPLHPYTAALVAATPDPHARWAEPILADASGAPPASGCALAPRCPRADDDCIAERPTLAATRREARAAACYHPFERDENVTRYQT